MIYIKLVINLKLYEILSSILKYASKELQNYNYDIVLLFNNNNLLFNLNTYTRH